MSNRVLICGVDTSKLPNIKQSRIMELLRQAQEGNEYCREELIISNMRLVLSIVQRFSSKKDSMDDLFQVGCVGLIKAIDNFDTTLNVKFSTYAVPMIIGEIKRFLRDASTIKVSRNLRDTAFKALKAREKLQYEMVPTLDDIAKEIDIPLRDVVCALDAVSEPISLFENVYQDDGESLMIMETLSDNKTLDENMIEDMSLKDAINLLSDREKNILFLRYYLGKTQIEISEDIGISQAQVSRIEKNALSAIKKLM